MSPIQLVVAAKASPFSYGKKWMPYIKEAGDLMPICVGVLAVASYINSVKEGSVNVELRDVKNLEGASKPAASISHNG